MKLPPITRIVIEDFEDEAKELISRLAGVMNPFMTDVTNVINGNLDITNLNQTVRTLSVTVDSNGVPIGNNTLNVSVKNRLLGVVCIKAENTTTPTNYVSSQPFVVYSDTSGGIIIKKITGLVAGEKFLLTLLCYGDTVRN